MALMRFCGLFSLALLSACDSSGGETAHLSGLDCYPAEAAAFISTAQDGVAVPRDPGGAYTIYLDGSASMVGYIRGGDATKRLMPDLVGMLPELPQIDRGSTTVWRFDRTFTELDQAGREKMQTEAGYLCPAGNPNCDAQESHIDAVFEKIADEPSDALSVVVSDLWLVNDEVLTSSGVAFARPFGTILSSGRGIAVYGFESPYAGRVSDLPSNRRDVTATGRYIFVMVAGPQARLDAFHRAMVQAPSARIAEAFTNGTARHALFSLEPAIISQSTQAIAAAPGSALTKQVFLPPKQGVALPQFALDREAALRNTKPDPGATWPGIAAANVRPGAIWQGPIKGQTRVWRQVSDSCAPKGADWRAEGTLAGGWSDDGTGRFTLDPAQLAQIGTGTFLIVGEATRVSLSSPNPDSQWMRDWSFASSGEAEAIARPIVPTLNLAETARLLELALLDAAERKPVRLGGFAAAITIE